MSNSEPDYELPKITVLYCLISTNRFGKGCSVRKTFYLSLNPTHTHLRLQLDFIKIDSWDIGEKAFVSVNGATVHT